MEPTLTKILADGLRNENVFGLLPKQAGTCVLMTKRWEETTKSFVTLCTDRSPSARYLADAWAPTRSRSLATVILQTVVR